MSKFIDSGEVSNALNKAKKVENDNLPTPNENANLVTQYKKLLDNTENKDRYAAITVKVSKQCRNYWQIEARKRKTSVTELVVQALLKEFGLPEDPENFLY